MNPKPRRTWPQSVNLWMRHYPVLWFLVCLVVSLLGFFAWNRRAERVIARAEQAERELVHAQGRLAVAQIQLKMEAFERLATERRNSFAAMDMSPADPAPSGRTGDVNGDGVVDVDDILAVMAVFSRESCESPCPEDICCCGPHLLDLDDLVAVLRAFSGETVICPPVECAKPHLATVMERYFEDAWVPLPWHEDGTIHIQPHWQVRPALAEGVEMPEGYEWWWVWERVGPPAEPGE